MLGAVEGQENVDAEKVVAQFEEQFVRQGFQLGDRTHLKEKFNAASSDRTARGRIYSD